MTGLVIEASGVTKSYAGVPAIVDADLEVRRGEVLGLVGENGAGKSTLVEILAGSVVRDSGSIRVDGTDVPTMTPKTSDSLGLRFLHQNLALIERLSVAENVLLGRPRPGSRGFVSSRTTRQRAADALAGIIDVDPGVSVRYLSVAQRWMVALAKACVGAAKVVVMDEPTVALSDTEVRTLFGVIRRLQARDISVVFVSHRLGEVLEICDRVAVMKDGRSCGVHEAATLSRDRLMSLILGSEASASVRELALEDPPQRGQLLLSARGLSGGPLSDVNLDLHAGEVLGVGGLVGSGRTYLLQQLFGMHRATAGTVHLAGLTRPIRSTTVAVKNGVALVPEDRRSQALLRLRSLRENLVLSSLPSHRAWTRIPLPSRKNELVASLRMIKSLDVKTTGPRQRVEHLSGGNQQKVVIGRALLLRGLKVLMLDEPTKGVDIGARLEIYGIIRDLVGRGLGVIVVSSDFEELAEISHRVVVIKEGAASGWVEAPMTEADILHLCF